MGCLLGNGIENGREKDIVQARRLRVLDVFDAVTRDAQSARKACAPELWIQVTWEVESGVVKFSKAPCIHICGVKDESGEDGLYRWKGLLEVPS